MKKIILLLGGARSGKSTFALEMAKSFPAKTLIAILAGLPRGALIDATFAGPGFTHDRHLGETVRRADAYGLLSARVCRLADELRGVCGQCHEKKEER